MSETYESLIRRAFKPEYWRFAQFIKLEAPTRSPGPGDSSSINGGLKYRIVPAAAADAFSLMETNFAFFYGVSVMLYEATLVSDETPFDDWMRGIASPAFGSREIAGLNVFVGKGKCIACHSGPELTAASIRNARSGARVIEPMLMGDRRPALYDSGFYNIGVTPTVEDLGRGAADPFGAPLAFARQFAFASTGAQKINFPIAGAPLRDVICDPADPNLDLDAATCDSAIFGFIDQDSGNFFPICIDRNADKVCNVSDTLLLKRVAVDGAFKTPGLRNVALTAPYFHNGSVATLREVVQFYNRGGNFCRFNAADLDPDITPLGLTEQEELDLVAFLVALSDRRVAERRAPFDHPEFIVPDGHYGNEFVVDDNGVGQAKDILSRIAAVGAGGGAPLPTFLGGLDQFHANPVAGGVCSAGFSASQ